MSKKGDSKASRSKRAAYWSVTQRLRVAQIRARILDAPGRHWQYDPDLETEIELRFIPDGKNATRVELEHRRLDRYGAHRDQMRRIFETEGDWGRLLEMFARVAAEMRT